MEKSKDEQTTPLVCHREVLHLEEGLENNQTSPLKISLKI